MAHVSVRGVWKKFSLHKDRADSVGQLLVRMIPGRRPPASEPFWALKDVSFSMSQGESLGIIGNNGSGKSTMLKILTHTMRPTLGELSVSGRISSLIELGAGFHPDFTGRENVVISASILGISRREILQRMDDIIDFSDIRNFIDVPVKYYSSGMHARLGFSVAIHVDPEIMIVDEVLAVGDEAFQQRCMDRIFQMKRAGISILLVSHDLSSVERLMDRAIWLNRGVVAAEGMPKEVIQLYRGEGTAPAVQHTTLQSSDMGAVQLTGVDVRTPGGGPMVPSGGEASITLEWNNESSDPLQGYVGISILRPDGLEIAELSGLRDQSLVTLRAGSSCVTVTFPQLCLLPGQYDVDVTLFGRTGARLGHWPKATAIHVQGAGHLGGVIAMPHDWQQQ